MTLIEWYRSCDPNAIERDFSLTAPNKTVGGGEKFCGIMVLKWQIFIYQIGFGNITSLVAVMGTSRRRRDDTTQMIYLKVTVRTRKSSGESAKRCEICEEVEETFTLGV